MTERKRPMPWDIAQRAVEVCPGVAMPDTAVSAGSVFLGRVWDAWQDRESHFGMPDDYVAELDEMIHAIADDIVPVYSHDIWTTYTDLCAYRVDMSDYASGIDVSDPNALERHAMATLYVVARCLLESLAASEAEA